MKKENIIEINIKLLLKNNLSVEQYFILKCVDNEDKNSLESYVFNRGTFDKSVFQSIVELGYLKPINSSITFDVLQLTKKYYDDFELNSELDHQKYFEELRALYPRKVKGRTALHSNLEQCRKKYKDIVTSEEKHNTILKCLRLYLADLEKDGKLEYIQMLPTWINQKTYESYLPDVEAGKLPEMKGGFIDDI